MAPIHDAAMVGNVKEVMRLVLEDPDGVDARDDGHDFTALYYACSKGHAEVACYLLHHDKVDVNRRVGGNQTLTTALHGACGNSGSNSINSPNNCDNNTTCSSSSSSSSSSSGGGANVQPALFKY